MKRQDFEAAVTEGYMRMPQWVREKIRNVALLIEDEPSVEVRVREGLQPDETLLGLYTGVPLSERGDMYGVGMVMPDTITLYQIPIVEASIEEHKDVRIVIEETIWHEIAHHFGMNEREVRRRECLKNIDSQS